MRQYGANLGNLFFLYATNISSFSPILSHDHYVWMQRCISGWCFGVSRVDNIVSNFRHFVRKTGCREDNRWVGIPRLEIILGFHQIPSLPGMQYQRQWCQEKPLLWEAVAFLVEQCCTGWAKCRMSELCYDHYSSS